MSMAAVKSPKVKRAVFHRCGKGQFLMGALRNEKLWQEGPLSKYRNMELGPRTIKSCRNPSMSHLDPSATTDMCTSV